MNTNGVFVTGIGVVCSAGLGTDELKDSMINGKSGVSKIDWFETRDLPSGNAGIINELRKNRKIIGLDLNVEFAISAIKQALKSSEITLDYLKSPRTALCLGTANSGISSLERAIKERDQKAYYQVPAHQLSDNTSKFFDIGGPSFTFTSACTAGSSAISFGFDLIESGGFDLVIAGGSDALSRAIFAGFHSLKSVSSTVCSPYDENIGLSLGEGAGIVILESRKSFEQRQKKPICRLLATGTSLDAYHVSAPDPNGSGVRRSINTSFEATSMEKKEVEYINTHGTGTTANDGSELAGIRSALHNKNVELIPVSSSKSYFGHTLGAAGAVELISTIVGLENKFVPSSLNHNRIRNGCEGFNIVTDGVRNSNAKTFLSTNSAFGGHNVAILGSFNKASRSIGNKSRKRRVFIAGTADIDLANEYQSNDDVSQPYEKYSSSKYSLKSEAPYLYKRRMSPITQYAIGATAKAQLDSGEILKTLKPEERGGYFATSIGSTTIQERYLKDLYDYGPDRVKSFHFVEMVLNSTLGSIAAAFQLKGCGSNISDGGSESIKALWAAWTDLRNSKIKGAVVTSAEDDSQLSRNIIKPFLGQDIDTLKSLKGAASTILLNEDALSEGHEVFGEIEQFISFSALEKSVDQVEFLLKNAIDRNSIDFIMLGGVFEENTLKILKIISKAFPRTVIFRNPWDLHGVVTPAHKLLNLAAMKLRDSTTCSQKPIRCLVVSTNINGHLTGCVMVNYPDIITDGW